MKKSRYIRMEKKFHRSSLDKIKQAFVDAGYEEDSKTLILYYRKNDHPEWEFMIPDLFVYDDEKRFHLIIQIDLNMVNGNFNDNVQALTDELERISPYVEGLGGYKMDSIERAWILPLDEIKTDKDLYELNLICNLNHLSAIGLPTIIDDTHFQIEMDGLFGEMECRIINPDMNIMLAWIRLDLNTGNCITIYDAIKKGSQVEPFIFGEDKMGDMLTQYILYKLNLPELILDEDAVIEGE